MAEHLITFIENLKSNPKVSTFNEAQIKNAVVLPILRRLGWDIENPEEVFPEYSVEARRVDYAIRLRNSNYIFLEVKNPAQDLDNHQEQLLDYSFRQGVELATLTNGMTWLFYLPMKKGDWKTRKFYTIDIIQQDSNDVISKFIDLLSRDNVQSGKAVQHAESIYKGRQKKKAIEDTLPEAWNKIIAEPDTLLIDLIAEITERLCGFKPVSEEVKKFLGNHEPQFLISPEQPEPPGQIRRLPTPIPPSRKISQDDLIPIIVEVLHKRGGKARKEEVEQEIYHMFRETFQQPWYQEKVAQGIPRWQHNLAWAKERAKKRGLIKWPEESGRGYWELTPGAIKRTL